jgi:carbonic anhydrase
MNKIITLSLCATFVALSSCKNRSESSHINKEQEHQHWSYEGETSPVHWSEIEKNSDCSGKKQSPINIIDINTITNSSDDNDLEILYYSKTNLTEVLNNGHTIEFDFEKGDSIKYKNEIFHLKQIHFHEPSEHTINGIRYPIEIHFVHKSNTDKLSVISILGEEGKENLLFDFLESFLPLIEGNSKEIHQPIDLTSLIPESQDFYSYSGSLTTPPCSENVNWIVMKQTIFLSENQVQILKESTPLNNYRNEQALNGRSVYLNIVNNQ